MLRQQEAERQRREMEVRFRNLRELSQIMYRGRPVPRAVAADIDALYRRPSEKELKVLRPLEEDLKKYASLLKQQRTGIVRLVEDAGCGDATRVVSAAGACLEYSMPGNGSSFSFREASYRLGRLADIRFANGNFAVTGVMQHGILTGLGDIALDEVTAETKGLEYLVNFKPAADLTQAVEIGKQLAAGTEQNGYLYARELRVVENMTYALRSVAYRGSVYRSINGYIYDELDFDTRLDILAAFRVVRRHDDNSVTVIWKSLSEKESPRLKREKDEPANSEKNNFVAKD